MTSTLKERRQTAWRRETREAVNRAARPRSRALPTIEQFAEDKAKEAAHFLDDREWIALQQHRRHLTQANRDHLDAALQRLIREAENVIAELRR
jgi:hypothetical protein